MIFVVALPDGIRYIRDCADLCAGGLPAGSRDDGGRRDAVHRLAVPVPRGRR